MAAMHAAASRPSPWHVVARRPVIRAYLTAYTLDTFGDLLWFVTLSWVAAETGNSAGLIMFAAGAPAILLIPLGGALIDRVGVARVALWTLVARTAVMVVWTAAIVAGATSTIIVPILAFFLGCIDGAHRPAIENWPVSIATREKMVGDQTSIFGLERAAARLCQFGAGAVGGWLVYQWGVGTPAAVAACLFVMALWIFRYLSRRVGTAPGPTSGNLAGTWLRELLQLWQNARRGWQIVRRHVVISRTLPVHSLYAALTGGLTLAALPLKSHASHWTAAQFGLIFAVWGLGLLVGTVGLLRLVVHVRRKVVLGLSLTIVVGGLICVFGLLDDPLSAAIVIGCAGVASGPVGPALGGYFREFNVTRESEQGALSGIQTLALEGMEPFGYLIFGAAAALVGIAVGCMVVGLVVIAMSVWALASRQVRTATS